MDVVPVDEDDGVIRVDFAVLEPRHPMVHPARQFADFGMQGAAERDAHFLQAAADAEQRHAARDAGLGDGERHASRRSS